jgi:hypothetical protein
VSLLLALQTGSLTINLNGVASAEAIGQPAVVGVVSAAGIASAEAVGSPAIVGVVNAAGVGTGFAAGSPAIAATIAAAGIPSGETFGLLTVTLGPIPFIATPGRGSPSPKTKRPSTGVERWAAEQRRAEEELLCAMLAVADDW